MTHGLLAQSGDKPRGELCGQDIHIGVQGANAYPAGHVYNQAGLHVCMPSQGLNCQTEQLRRLTYESADFMPPISHNSFKSHSSGLQLDGRYLCGGRTTDVHLWRSPCLAGCSQHAVTGPKEHHWACRGNAWHTFCGLSVDTEVARGQNQPWITSEGAAVPGYLSCSMIFTFWWNQKGNWRWEAFVNVFSRPVSFALRVTMVAAVVVEGRGVAGAKSSSRWAQVWLHPGKVTSSSQGSVKSPTTLKILVFLCFFMVWCMCIKP